MLVPEEVMELNPETKEITIKHSISINDLMDFVSEFYDDSENFDDVYIKV